MAETSPATNSLGSFEAMLETIWFDQLFVGASAISADGAIDSVDSAKASLNKRMLTRSAHRFVLADSSKFGTTATYKVAPLSTARVIISTFEGDA
jgi:DeoR family fructose operon transcriptional repressor